MRKGRRRRRRASVCARNAARHIGRRSNSKFCSDTCRQRAHRGRLAVTQSVTEASGSDSIAQRRPYRVTSRCVGCAGTIRPVLEVKPTCHGRSEIDASDPQETCTDNSLITCTTPSWSTGRRIRKEKARHAKFTLRVGTEAGVHPPVRCDTNWKILRCERLPSARNSPYERRSSVQTDKAADKFGRLRFGHYARGRQDRAVREHALVGVIPPAPMGSAGAAAVPVKMGVLDAVFGNRDPEFHPQTSVRVARPCTERDGNRFRCSTACPPY